MDRRIARKYMKKRVTIASTPTRNNAGLVLARGFSRAGEACRCVYENIDLGSPNNYQMRFSF
jgi:hypothetical protein